jgi:hypothetical protein
VNVCTHESVYHYCIVNNVCFTSLPSL